MNEVSRRAFCRFCLVAGASLSPAISLAEAFPPGSAPQGPPDIGQKDASAGRDIDFAKCGYCGYRCDICPGRSDDKRIRRAMVDGWIKLYGHTSYTDENIPVARPCAGCRGNGEVADTQCPARPCARDKKVILCADCDQFPCKKLDPLLADRYQLLLSFRGKGATLEEYRMSAMQFENIPVLVRRMADIGKLPSWVKDLL